MGKLRIVDKIDARSAASSQSLNVGMISSFNFEPLLDALADRITAKLLKSSPRRDVGPDDPLLLTVEQAARKLGRSVSAVEHLIRKKKLTAVKIDRRVSVDYRDILTLIDRHKIDSDT
jgi:excisionase family DNA binding protein